VEALQKEISTQRETHRRMQETLDRLSIKSDAMISGSELLQKTADLGLVSIHASREDAIEDEFFSVISKEDQGIDIAGSTIFGLRGRREVKREDVLSVLTSKVARKGFEMRILLTHWDFISQRQDQEKTQKNLERFVISKELREAVELLEREGLSDYVRFCRAAPTCFTVICHGQQMMLANPYPYLREAFTSWTVVFRDTGPKAIYRAFAEAHFEEPWKDERISIPFDSLCVEAVEEKLERDVREAKKDLQARLASEVLGTIDEPNAGSPAGH